MKILICDANNLAYRNHYAQNLQTTSGQSTGMVYGVVNSLITLTRDLNPDVVHAVWDPKGGSAYRKGLYKLYKANREKKSDEFYDELNLLKQLLHALGVTQICKEGVETDDVIGFLAKKYSDEGHDVFITTNDVDIYQLISERVKIAHPEKGIIGLDECGKIAIKEQGKTIWLRPDQIPDYKALVGDVSDNYPGMIGFGIGAAINYFSRNERAEAILDNTADLRNQRPQALNALITGRSMIGLFKDLATINITLGEVEIPLKPARNEELALGLMDHLELNQFKALGSALYRIGGN